MLPSAASIGFLRCKVASLQFDKSGVRGYYLASLAWRCDHESHLAIAGSQEQTE